MSSCSILLLIYFCTAKLFCQESFIPCVLLLPVWSFLGQLWLFMHDCSDPVTAPNISFIYLLLFYRSLSFPLFFHSIHFSSTFSIFPSLSLSLTLSIFLYLSLFLPLFFALFLSLYCLQFLYITLMNKCPHVVSRDIYQVPDKQFAV